MDNDSKMTVEQRIARRVRAIRLERGLTQKELADKCETSNATISNIERGGDYRVSTLRKIEEVLQCTLIVVPNEDL